MSKHITVSVVVTETQEREVDQYNKVKAEREVTELAKLTVRADSVSDAHRKVRAVMEGALPLGTKAEFDKLLRSSTYGKEDNQPVTPGLVP